MVLLSEMVTGRFVMAVPLPASRKPELKPFTVMFVSCAGMQGVANSDWIAEWLPWVTVRREGEGVGVSG